MIRLTAVSGFGGKAPACFLVETGDKRILLDLGAGPDVGAVVDVSDVGPVNALILSHGHPDHWGGLDRLPMIGAPPVYASLPLLARLPGGLAGRDLPLGSSRVAGIPVTAGRAGHAPDGLWIHFDIGGGLLYMGDHCHESDVFAIDPPPPSELVVVDASYGADDTPQAERVAALDAALNQGSALLPVPAYGRGAEIALHLARLGRLPSLCPVMRSALRAMATDAAAWLKDGIAEHLLRIAAEAPDIGDRAAVTLASGATCEDGPAAEWAARWENTAEPAILFTGHVPSGTPAARLIATGRARRVRWNVHPRISDLTALVGAVGARIVVPAFCGPADIAAVAAMFGPAVHVASAEGFPYTL